MTPRRERLERLRSGEVWDVAIIGGGATGLGAAVDAASRGYRTVLLERDDFAKGTSSRSTKLVHGGVRYLAQRNIKLVREALRERGLLFRNAPHLVRDRAFLVPAYRWGERSYYGLGLWVYDRLAGKLGIGRSRQVGRDEATRWVPTLEPLHLRGGVLYHDGQFDDARLAITLARTADDHRANVLNAVAVIGFQTRADGELEGVRAQDTETGEEFSIKARVTVNASGVFADEVRRLDDAGAESILTPSQGAHIVLERAFLPGDAALMVPKTADGRVLFAIPWKGHVIVGTTDTPVGRVEREPRPLDVELDFLLTHARRYLTRDPNPSDVRSTFAGLRPLFRPLRNVGSTSTVSREHAILVSRSGLVTIAGGKWTTYRRMGQDVIDRASKVGGLPATPSTTETLRLHGWTEDASGSPYGSDREEVERVCSERPEFQERLHPRLSNRLGEVVWVARHESARTVEDVLARRSRALFLEAAASLEAAPRVAAILAEELGHDADWANRQVDQFRQLAMRYMMG